MKLECGDFVLFSNKDLAMVIRYGYDFTLVFFDDALVSDVYMSTTLEGLYQDIMSNKNVRIIKSEYITIKEIYYHELYKK